VIGGLNCLPLGEDVLLINNTACINGFELVFLLRIIFGICSFSVLVALFCSTCTTVRHYNQLNFIKNVLLKDPLKKNVKGEETRDQLY
jgi:hypothetical protein